MFKLTTLLIGLALLSACASCLPSPPAPAPAQEGSNPADTDIASRGLLGLGGHTKRAAVLFTDAKTDDKLLVAMLMRMQMGGGAATSKRGDGDSGEYDYDAVYPVITGVKDADGGAKHMYGFMKRMAAKHGWDAADFTGQDRLRIRSGPTPFWNPEGLGKAAVPHETFWKTPVKDSEGDDGPPPGGVEKYKQNAVVKELNGDFDSVDVYQIAPAPKDTVLGLFKGLHEGKARAYFQLVGYNSRQATTGQADPDAWPFMRDLQEHIHERHKDALVYYTSNAGSFNEAKGVATEAAAEKEAKETAAKGGEDLKESQSQSVAATWVPTADLLLAEKDPFWTGKVKYASAAADEALRKELDAAVEKGKGDLTDYVHAARKADTDAGMEARNLLHRVVLSAVKNQDDCASHEDRGAYVKRDCDKLKSTLGPALAPDAPKGITIELGDANLAALMLAKLFGGAWPRGVAPQNVVFSRGNPPDMYRYRHAPDPIEDEKQDPRPVPDPIHKDKMLNNLWRGDAIEDNESQGLGIYGATTAICRNQINRILNVS